MNLFSVRFWGIYLIIVGIVALIKSYYPINIDLGRLAFGILLVWVGVVLAFGGGVSMSIDTDPETIMFDSDSKTMLDGADYNLIFGEGMYYVPDSSTGTIKLNAVFSSAEVNIPSDTPIKISVSSAFGSVTTPDGNSTNFGSSTYYSDDYSPEEGVHLEVSTVFGSVILRR